MNRPRNTRILTPLRKISGRHEKILIALERYDHLDTKHLALITGLSLKNLEVPARQLFDAGLVDRPAPNLYKRDRRNDPAVHRRTDASTDWLERHDLVPHRAVYRAAGGQPPHDLAVSQLGVCIELAHQAAGLPFFTADEIMAKAPEATRNQKNPFRFETSHGHILPDLLFATEYADEFLISFMEVNLSDHGEQEYKRKQLAYDELIFAGIYKNQLGMKQKARLLTFDNSLSTTKAMLRHTQRRDPFYFKMIPTYGRFEIAPPPVENILENWRDLKGHTIDLTEVT